MTWKYRLYDLKECTDFYLNSLKFHCDIKESKKWPLNKITEFLLSKKDKVVLLAMNHDIRLLTFTWTVLRSFYQHGKNDRILLINSDLYAHVIYHNNRKRSFITVIRSILLQYAYKQIVSPCKAKMTLIRKVTIWRFTITYHFFMKCTF